MTLSCNADNLFTSPVGSQPQTILEALPSDLLESILYRLNHSEREAVIRVSRATQKALQNVVNLLDPLSIRNFIYSIRANLDPNTDCTQIHQLADLAQCINTQNFTTLPEGRLYCLKQRQHLIQILQTLDDARILHLIRRIQVYPIFMEGVFHVSLVHQKMLSIRNMDWDDELNLCVKLRECIQQLANLGEFEEAVQVAQDLCLEQQTDSALCDICNILIAKEQIEPSMHLIQLVRRPLSKENMIFQLGQTLLHRKEITQTLKLTDWLPDTIAKERVFSKLANLCVSLGLVEQGMSAAEKILTNSVDRDLWLQSFIKPLIDADQLQNFLSVVQTVVCSDKKDLCLFKGVMELIGVNQIPRALDVIHLMTHPHTIQLAFERILDFYLSRGSMQAAVKTVLSMNAQHEIQCSLFKVATHFSKEGHLHTLEHTIAAAQLIIDESQRSLFLSFIAKKLVSLWYTIKAEEVARKIPNESMRERTLDYIRQRIDVHTDLDCCKPCLIL